MADFINNLKDLVDDITNQFNNLTQENSLRVDYGQELLKQCHNTINNFNTLLDSKRTVQERRSLQAHITYLNWIADHLLRRIGNQNADGDLQVENCSIKWHDLLNAFADNIQTGCVINLNHTDLKKFIEESQKFIFEKVQGMLRTVAGLKVNVELSCIFRNTKSGEVIDDSKSFKTKSREILPTTPIEDWFTIHVYDKLLRKVEEFELKDSGWRLLEINSLIITMSKYTPTQAGISTFVCLPKDIKEKRAVVNIQNKDEFCFLWCVNAALHPRVNMPEKPESYNHFRTKLKYEGINFPIVTKDIPKFEQMNQLSINVYGIDSKDRRQESDKSIIIPLYLSKFHQTNENAIHLLMVRKSIENSNDLDNIESVCHFAWIRSLSRLIRSQVTRSKNRLFFCDRCLNHFKLEKSFEKHRLDCFKINKVRMEFPDEENRILKFKDFKFKDPVPFVVYADLECILLPQEDDKICHKHVPHSVAYYIHCKYDNTLSKLHINRSPNCIEWFIKQLESQAHHFESILKKRKKMMTLTKEQQERYDHTTVCHICKKLMTDEDKCRDHCHFTGIYRNAAHRICNINYRKPSTIPVVFHNLSGYDSHFIIKALATVFEGKIQLLPVNKEHYISFTKIVENTSVSLRFIDSFRFMASSLEELVSNLDDSDKRITQLHYPDPNHFKLVTRKGVFPYEYIDSIDKFNEKQLPSQDSFYSNLTKTSVSYEDYAFAQEVWDKFKIRTLGDYSDLYLKTDVLLLADVFENFRSSCFKTYELDALHFYTAPGLSHSAMLKYTGVELELLTDPEMHLFIEKGIRGGVSMCANRYAKANNRYMGEDFDQTKPETYLMYYDVNNLYGAAMSMPLPIGSFEWVEDVGNVNKFFNDDENVGYILEVDLHYPEKLHDLHKDLPFCPEHLVPPGSKQRKLLTTLFDKNNYVIHYKNLKQCLDSGLVLKTIHRVLKFKQSNWLKSYIDKNTDCRKLAKNDFEKDFYKLMNNSVFGKMMENVRKHKEIWLRTKWKGRYNVSDLISKPNFHSLTVFDGDLVVIELKKAKILFNKPIFVGFCILDLSKTFLYDFHYNYVLKNYEKTSKLLYTDTDSLIYEFTVPNIYEDMKRDISRFDTSDYPSNNIFNMPLANKKVLGLMKDENKGKIMFEFVGLRAKLYAFEIYNPDEEKNRTKKRAKGVRRSALETITFDDFKRCLSENSELKVDQYLITSKRHVVYTTYQSSKRALSWDDDKRQLIERSFNTLPWGYKPK